MDYAPPLNADPVDGVYPLSPYWNKDPSIGLVGAKVPADALNGPLFEILNAITGAGLTPSSADLTQLLQAITIIARAAAGRLITSPLMLTVDPGVAVSDTNFHTVQAAFDSLATARIMPGIVVTISVAAGVHTITDPITVDHVDASRIWLVGANLPGAFPVYADIHSVLATARTNLRAKVPTVISIQGVNGLYVRQGGLGKIKNIMFDHNGAGGLSAAIACVVSVEGSTVIEDCVMFGCKLAGSPKGAGLAADATGKIYCYNVMIAHCDEFARALGRSIIELDGPASPLVPLCRAHASLGRGVIAGSGGEIRLGLVTISDVVGFGAFAETGGLIVIGKAAVFGSCGGNLGANGGHIHANGLPFLSTPLTLASMTANDGGYIQVELAGGSDVTCNPTVRTVGNHNSYIRII